jgi:PAS domain S-box-containing protein
MDQIGTPLSGSYDPRLVALSVFIAISTSYTALDLGSRVTAARGWTRSAWLAGGATAMGLGIWSTHFTGMLAFRLPVPVAYYWPTVLLSLLCAILASAVALYVVSRKEMGRVQALAGSAIMGVGIVVMHYSGMASMRLSAVCRYRPSFVALSVLIAILASLVGLAFTFDYRKDFRGTTLAKVISAAAMGAAIALTHYSGMLSVSFLPASVPPNMFHAVGISTLGLGGIAVGSLVVQGTAVLTSAADRRFAAQAQELQTSELFRQIADILRDVLAVSNADCSQVLFVNRAYETIWGRTAESLYAAPRSSLEGVHPDDRQQTEEAVQRLRDGKPIDDLECRVVRPDGSISWVRLRAYPVADAQGHPYRIVGTAHEFTKRKLAEDARRQIEELHRIVIETATDAVVSIDEDSQILLANPAMARVFGYEPSEVIGQALTMLMPSFMHELHKTSLQRYLATGQKRINWQGVELIGLRKNREEFPVEVSFGEVLKQGRRVFTGFIRDITERKQAEERLRHLSSHLLRLQDEERRRIGRELHDSTGQDLVALATMLGQLSGSIPSVERKSSRLLSQSRALADKCIRDVRTLSYLLHPPVLDDAGLGDAIRDYVKGFTKRSGIQVELELSPRVERMGREIELALFRVVQESLTNIHRHSGSKRAKIRMHRNSELNLEISDFGQAVSAKESTGREKPRFHTGVGIPSMQERVKLIGGRFEIDFTSKGTSVRVTIPLGGNECEKPSHSDS